MHEVWDGTSEIHRAAVHAVDDVLGDLGRSWSNWRRRGGLEDIQILRLDVLRSIEAGGDAMSRVRPWLWRWGRSALTDAGRVGLRAAGQLVPVARRMTTARRAP